jgi:pyruvate formate lyase activating enzyme
MITGRVFDIQRFCIHDGPGIRTTVFLKGCPLRCLWCANPESQEPKPSLSYIPANCIGCDACQPVCTQQALSRDDDGTVVLDRAKCNRCGQCDDECDAEALEMVGRRMSVDEVLEVVLRDSAYYKASGGGLTLSGGEPLMQSRFAREVFTAAKAKGIHCCIETSGYALWNAVRGLVPLVDLWLFDWKESDDRLHERFTGRSNQLVRSNLQRLHDEGAKILVRCPMIPRHNMHPEHFDGIIDLVRSLPGIEGVQLLPYHDLWRSKLDRFGLKTDFPRDVKPPSRCTMQQWQDYLQKRGAHVVAAN